MKYCYRGTDGDIKPVKCKIVEKFGYPYYCINEDGEREDMYFNTHFLTEKEAWKSIVFSINAGIYLLKNDYDLIKNLEKRIVKKKEEIKELKEEFEKVKNNKSNPYIPELKSWDD